jgi:hypothetical protein
MPGAAVALKLALLAPATIEIEAGTASAVLLLASVSVAPEAVAVWLSVTVHELTSPGPKLPGSHEVIIAGCVWAVRQPIAETIAKRN